MEATFSTVSNRRSYRCYNCNEAFHITPISSGVSSSFRCPRCFHRHLLPNYTIASVILPSQSSTANFTPPTTYFFTYDSSDSDVDGTDSNDNSFDFFNPSQYCYPTLKSFLNSLPSLKIDDSSKSCSICMEEFVIGSTASQLPCKHFFHNACIIPWLNQSNTCPLCRHKLPFEDEDEIEKNLQVTLDGQIGDREIQDNGVVLTPTTTSYFSGSREVGDNLRERDLEEMRDEDGDILMADG